MLCDAAYIACIDKTKKNLGQPLGMYPAFWTMCTNVFAMESMAYPRECPSKGELANLSTPLCRSRPPWRRGVSGALAMHRVHRAGHQLQRARSHLQVIAVALIG